MGKGDLLLEIGERELDLLKEFSRVLKDERDAIISFSLEGIIRENNRKEELLKKIEYLEEEKEALLKAMPNMYSFTADASWKRLGGKIDETVEEVRTGLKRNMSLLSFSVDHVKSSIEKIVHFINKTGYGRKRGSISFLLSREV